MRHHTIKLSRLTDAERARLLPSPRRNPAGICAVCGCADDNCTECIKATGVPCHWVDASMTLCSRCEEEGGR